MARPLPELARMLTAALGTPLPDLTAPVADLRAAADAGTMATAALVRPAGPLADVLEVEVGTARVRVYRAVEQEHGDAVHVHLHGGGWWMGNLDTADAMARELASASGLTVVSVGYRLAPEHPFPAGLDDAYAALCWASETLRPTSLSIGGESAGANLAASACLMARERGGPAIAGQWLDVPGLDARLPDSPSMAAYGVGYGIDVEPLRPILDWYAGSELRVHPLVSPLLAEDHSGLPPAIITTAELDPLRDQGAAYAAALRTAGVPVEHTDWAGHLHGSMWLTALTASAAEWHAACVSALVRLHLASRQAAA